MTDEAEAVTFGDGKEHSFDDVAGKSRKPTFQEWLSLGECFGEVAGDGHGLVIPNTGFPLADFMDRWDRVGQITIDKTHSSHVSELSKYRGKFKWPASNPLREVIHCFCV